MHTDITKLVLGSSMVKAFACKQERQKKNMESLSLCNVYVYAHICRSNGLSLSLSVMCVSMYIYRFFLSTFSTPPAPKHSGAFLQPDLADGEDEVINQDIIELQKKLHQAVKVLKFFSFQAYQFPENVNLTLFVSIFL